MVVRQTVSAGQPALIAGLPPVEFAVLEPAGWENIGDLGLLDTVLQRIEAANPDLTVTRSLFFLKQGKTVSFCGLRRRACLLAILTSPQHPPKVLIDVDHTGLNGLSGLLLCYVVPILLADMAGNLQLLLGSLVDNQGHWDNTIESQFSKFVTIKRMPKLLRMTERAEDEEYLEGWVERLSNELL